MAPPVDHGLKTRRKTPPLSAAAKTVCPDAARSARSQEKRGSRSRASVARKHANPNSRSTRPPTPPRTSHAAREPMDGWAAAGVEIVYFWCKRASGFCAFSLLRVISSSASSTTSPNTAQTSVSPPFSRRYSTPLGPSPCLRRCPFLFLVPPRPIPRVRRRRRRRPNRRRRRRWYFDFGTRRYRRRSPRTWTRLGCPASTRPRPLEEHHLRIYYPPLLVACASDPRARFRTAKNFPPDTPSQCAHCRRT